MTTRVGLLKTSLVDYPGEVAATVFTAGCNLRCPYCHNPELVSHAPPDTFIDLRQALDYLRKRRGVLGGVCITGGEPLLQPWLGDVIVEIRGLGLKVKLDTNGLLPDRLAELNVDYLAVDLKLAPERYRTLGGTQDAPARLKETIDWAHGNGIALEFRTTVVPRLVTADDILAIAALLRPGDRLTLAAFRPNVTLDPAYGSIPAPEPAMMEAFRELALEAGLQCEVRDHRTGSGRELR